MIASMFAAAQAAAANLPVRGAPEPGQIGFQEAATPVMEALTGFHFFLVIIITLITLFVLGLMLYSMIRHNHRVRPEPAKFSHNTLVEIVWTLVPVLILIVIAVPSFRLLYFQDVIPEADMTVKATGYQWYWEYEYPEADVSITSIMLPREQAEAEGKPPLLAVDNPLIVPAGAVVRLQVTGADVIHSWAMPAFGVKTDAIPGRLNETWFKVDKPGIYYGQCSELCGKDHAFMPIEVHVVPPAQYTAWMNEQTGGETQVAAADTEEGASE